jgi:hypothetical protein
MIAIWSGLCVMIGATFSSPARGEWRVEGESAMRIKWIARAVFAIFGLVPLSPAAAQYPPNEQFSEGPCGGVMTGYDRRQYRCEANRKPVCEQSTGRCVCLLRRECGADRDENF